MAWIYLLGAIFCEVSGTTCMKLSAGFTKVIPTVAMAIAYVASFSLLTIVVKIIDVSIAYAIWSGLGTLLIAIVGMLWFKEPMTIIKGVCIMFIIIGVVGLRLQSSSI